MAKTLVDIREMLKKLAKDVCKSPKSWMNYLNTASRFYRYSFFDTLLIHAQRPEAIACASMPEWNKIMKVEEQRHTLVSPHKSLKERIIAERPKTDALVQQRGENRVVVRIFELERESIY